jgi:hypothetical protein
MKTRYHAEHNGNTVFLTEDLYTFMDFLTAEAENDRDYADSLQLFEQRGDDFYAQSLSTYEI